MTDQATASPPKLLTPVSPAAPVTLEHVGTRDDNETVHRVRATFSPDLVRSEVAAAYRQLQRTTVLPGFRKGKIPMSVLTRRFAKDVEGSVIAKLLEQALPAAVDSLPWKVVDLTLAGDVEFDPKGVALCELTVEVVPEIPLDHLAEVTVDSPPEGDLAEEGDELIRQLLAQAATRRPVEDRPAQEGDRVTIDLHAYDASEAELTDDATTEPLGEPLPHLAQTLRDLPLDPADPPGSPLLAMVLARVEGMSPGQTRALVMDLPAAPANEAEADAGTAEHRRVQVVFTLTEIVEVEEPELTDDFVRAHFQVPTVDQWRALVQEMAKRRLQQRADQALVTAVVEALADAHPVPVPPSLLLRHLEALVAQVSQADPRRLRGLVKIEDLPQDVVDRSTEELRRQLIRQALVDHFHIEATDAEILAQLAQMFFPFQAHLLDESQAAAEAPPEEVDLDQIRSSLQQLMKGSPQAAHRARDLVEVSRLAKALLESITLR